MTEMVTDEQLMQRFAKGDSTAFNRLFSRYKQRLYGFLRQQLPGALADELCQETWESVIRHSASYQPTAKFQTYLFTIGRRKVIDHWRTQKPSESLDDNLLYTTGPEVRLASEQTASALMTQVAALPFVQKEAFLLKESGMSVQEVADITGVGYETAKSRLKLAFRKLRSTLEAQYAEA
ncbi:sigma-70 family RNA polymerase sigma factor [Corallincola luteus]|uniref:RNA polymerase subunit sigma-24 n=2 Tax=Corallincola TaxID=1775176 RepID=A0A368NQB1_9GAMM|nr:MULTISPECIES: sigma-70 family RNA polymerase sigma factor [Corallincola]RCU52757.1 RNA polymerase subunit sigma-24 [Corallincola holothuriorum]TCI03257.1 sigma-70 family RNA polymerase sigma factor [Corallincola luteus]